MAARHTFHVALTESLVQHVRDQIGAGRYSTASELLREALRLMIERDTERDRDNSSVQQSPAHHG